MRVPIKFISEGGWGTLSEQEITDICIGVNMKRDAIESLTKIRKLCNDWIQEMPDLYKMDKSDGLLCQIEWICRHALEDYGDEQKLTVVSVRSESGDHYGPYLFKEKPSDEKLEEFLREEAPDEFVEGSRGPGDFGSYLYVTISTASINV